MMNFVVMWIIRLMAVPSQLMPDYFAKELLKSETVKLLHTYT